MDCKLNCAVAVFFVQSVRNFGKLCLLFLKFCSVVVADYIAQLGFFNSSGDG